ncbi:MAG TPA: nuclear transport factor 2 family protein [Micromonosporaceae bacterium]|nr:nuclear transport factor 2 family protein [Micromonosporaceae bacterium]
MADTPCSPISGRASQAGRQILVRARAHVEEARPRFEVSPEQRDVLAKRFFAACRDGDVAGLERLLAEDVQFHGDGGGKAPAVREAVTGRIQVARFLLGLVRQARANRLTIDPAWVNGQHGAQVRDEQGSRTQRAQPRQAAPPVLISTQGSGAAGGAAVVERGVP